MSELLILEEGQSYSAGICRIGDHWYLTNYFNEDGTWRRDRSASSIALTTAQVDRIHARAHADDANAPRYTEAEWREIQVQQERELMRWQADACPPQDERG